MEKQELFSIVIPTYNREKTIGRAVKSVLNQSYQNIEVVICDDGSTDDTKEILEEYLKDERVKYVFQENQGAQVARNHGLSVAKGIFILFLDSDDELLPQCLEKVIDLYHVDPELGAVYFKAGKIRNGQLTAMRKEYIQGYSYKEVLAQGYLTSSSFITMKRSIFERIGNWDEAFPASQDDDICFRIARQYKIGFINEILGIYNFDAGIGNQISDSAIRVANGWWILWNKYEQDVIKFCGCKVLRRHFIDCAMRFRLCGEKKIYIDCLSKIKEYTNCYQYSLSIILIHFLIAKRLLKNLLISIYKQ